MTLEEAAEDAFRKAELVKALEMSNTQISYEKRKEVFIRLVIARRDAKEAEDKLQKYYAR